MTNGRIAVGVSGAGTNLRALAAAADRGELGGAIVLVFADRSCPALDWAAEQALGIGRLIKNNPRSFDAAAMRGLVRAAYDGDLAASAL